LSWWPDPQSIEHPDQGSKLIFFIPSKF
jgi:hypothetical protein